jgi:hypothetical protein
MVDPERGGDVDRMREPDSAIDLFASETEPDAQSIRESVAADLPSKPADRRPGVPRSLVAGALVLGAALGFASGYTVATRQTAPGGLTVPPTTSVATLSDRDASSASVVPKTGESGGPVASEVVNLPADGVPMAEAAAPAAPASVGTPNALGRLLVRSTPAEARVFVDGQEEGATPLALRELAPGPHLVGLARPGYVTEERRVVITRADPAQSITVELERSGESSGATPGAAATFGISPGSLLVGSLPSGAKVFVDRKLVGTTPLLMPDVDTGGHEIGLDLEGFRPWSSSIVVQSGERSRVTASLQR